MVPARPIFSALFASAPRFRSWTSQSSKGPFHVLSYFRPRASLDQVMAGGPAAMEEMQKDPETAELLQKLEKAMGGMMP